MTASSGRARILPMKTAGTKHFIDRTYREGGTFRGLPNEDVQPQQ